MTEYPREELKKYTDDEIQAALGNLSWDIYRDQITSLDAGAVGGVSGIATGIAALISRLIKVTLPTCWRCDGLGRIVGVVHVNKGYDEAIGGCRGDFKDVDEACPVCDGSGRVAQSQIEGRDFGNRVRAWRADQGMILLTMADDLNIPVSDLSSYELGLKPWPADVRAAVEIIIGDV